MGKDKKLTQGQLLFFSLAFIILGNVLIVEPNLRGPRGYHELNTLGRAAGVIAFSMGVKGINYKKKRFMDINLKGFLLILSIVMIVSGLVGFSTGYSIGLFNADYIRDPFARSMELVYAVLGICLFILHKKIEGFFKDFGK